MQTSAATRFEKERGVTDVRVTPGIAHVALTLAPSERLPALRALAGDGVAVFFVKLTQEGITFAVRQPQTEGCRDVLEREARVFFLQEGLALVSVVAGAMRDLSGVMADVYDTLLGIGVGIRQTGDSYDAVHVLVDGAQAEAARAALAARFGSESRGV